MHVATSIGFDIGGVTEDVFLSGNAEANEPLKVRRSSRVRKRWAPKGTEDASKVRERRKRKEEEEEEDEGGGSYAGSSSARLAAGSRSVVGRSPTGRKIANAAVWCSAVPRRPHHLWMSPRVTPAQTRG